MGEHQDQAVQRMIESPLFPFAGDFELKVVSEPMDAELTREEATLLTALLSGLGQYVLDGTMTAQAACDVIDHHFDRLFEPGDPRC